MGPNYWETSGTDHNDVYNNDGNNSNGVNTNNDNNGNDNGNTDKCDNDGGGSMMQKKTFIIWSKHELNLFMVI